MIKAHADFNGLFGELLCLSHGETWVDENGVLTGTVEVSPDWLQRHGSKWVLRIDENGVRHESEIRK